MAPPTPVRSPGPSGPRFLAEDLQRSRASPRNSQGHDLEEGLLSYAAQLWGAFLRAKANDCRHERPWARKPWLDFSFFLF